MYLVKVISQQIFSQCANLWGKTVKGNCTANLAKKKLFVI